MTAPLEPDWQAAGRALLDWFAAHARDLPWRRDRADAYRVLVSEFMLQQTRVDTVVPYYHRFLRRFPTLADLAEADEEEVLKAWEGLGYYGRARRLHAAVREVQARYGGHLPVEADDLQRLPGVGAYTAAAVSSIAYGRDVIAIDGNVLRVAARLFRLDGDVRRPEVRRRAAALLGKMLPPGRAGDFNQALMDLGSSICRPAAPDCPRCPIAPWCQGSAAGEAATLPRRTARSRPPVVARVGAVIVRGGRHLVARRRTGGLLGGLWEFPAGERNPGETWTAALCRVLSEAWGLSAVPGPCLLSARHEFSHLRWAVRVYRAELSNDLEPVCAPGYDRLCWVSAEELARLPFPSVYRELVAGLQADGA